MEQFELIICIVNKGFNEQVMDAARECGARGGTVINARGTASEDLVSKFDFQITPEKEVVLLLVSSDIKEDVLHALYQKVGLNSPGQGIAFTLPVDEVVGIGKTAPKIEENQEKKEN